MRRQAYAPWWYDFEYYFQGVMGGCGCWVRKIGENAKWTIWEGVG